MDRRTFLKFFGIYLLSRQIGFQRSTWAFAPAITPPQSLGSSSAGRKNPDSHQSAEPNHDIRLSPNDSRTLQTVLARFTRIQATVGHGKFCLLGFDESLRIARGYHRVGAFSGSELTFLEKIFHTDARGYGFKGRKIFDRITDCINTPMVNKIPGTGNYLYNGDSLKTYQRLTRDVGDQLVLTAGIRGMAKQFYLFLRKVSRCQGNLSRAAHSLAPPGYSYHGIGDFDVGQAGYGAANFTERFSRTSVYREIARLDYVIFRYPRNNRWGVRFEPWHIQVSPNVAKA